MRGCFGRLMCIAGAEGFHAVVNRNRVFHIFFRFYGFVNNCDFCFYLVQGRSFDLVEGRSFYLDEVLEEGLLLLFELDASEGDVVVVAVEFKADEVAFLAHGCKSRCRRPDEWVKNRIAFIAP